MDQSSKRTRALNLNQTETTTYYRAAHRSLYLTLCCQYYDREKPNNDTRRRHALGRLEVAAGDGGVVATHVDVPVDDAGKAAANERADPIDPDVGEVAAGHGGAEGAGRIHGPAGEGAGDEDVGANDEADGDGGDGAKGSLLGVGRGGVHGVDEAEGDDDLHHNAFERADAGQAVGRGRLSKKKDISVAVRSH